MTFATSKYSTGDEAMDKLLTEYANAIFDCGDFRDVGEDEAYDGDRKYHRYEDAMAAADRATQTLFTAIRAALGKNEEQK